MTINNSHFAVGLLLLLTINSAISENLEVGQSIYNQGLDNHKVDMGEGFDVSAQYFPCANCHGRWGQGLQEAGVYAPNITWQQLSKPYQLQSTQGRQRKPYDLALFSRALSSGVDSSGATLSNVMPKYDYNASQVTALWEALKHLSKQEVPGVESNILNIGVILGDEAHRQTIIKILQTYFKQINNTGGIFQRQLRLIIDKTAAFKPDCCIAFMAYQIADFPKWTVNSTRISVFSTLNDTSQNTENPIFALYPGSQHQLKILRDYFNKNNNESSEMNWQVKPSGTELVTKRGQAEFLNVVKQSAVELQWIPEQLWMLSASKLLLQALNQVGRDVDSQKLIDALSNTHDYHTHFGPALSYGPQRFVGAQGAMIKKSIDQKWLWYQSEVSNQ